MNFDCCSSSSFPNLQNSKFSKRLGVFNRRLFPTTTFPLSFTLYDCNNFSKIRHFSPILSYGSIPDHQTVRCSQIVFNVHWIFFNMKNRGHYSNVVSYTTLINEYNAIYGIRDVLKVFGEILVEEDKF